MILFPWFWFLIYFCLLSFFLWFLWSVFSLLPAPNSRFLLRMPYFPVMLLSSLQLILESWKQPKRGSRQSANYFQLRFHFEDNLLTILLLLKQKYNLNQHQDHKRILYTSIYRMSCHDLFILEKQMKHLLLQQQQQQETPLFTLKEVWNRRSKNITSSGDGSKGKWVGS